MTAPIDSSNLRFGTMRVTPKSQWIAEKLGASNWVIARRTTLTIAKYGADAAFITAKRFSELEKQYEVERLSNSLIHAEEFVAAQRWRIACGLTKEQLGPMIGWSPLAIYWFERGGTPPGRWNAGKEGEIKPANWKRYKAACAGVDAALKSKRQFNW